MADAGHIRIVGTKSDKSKVKVDGSEEASAKLIAAVGDFIAKHPGLQSIKVRIGERSADAKANKQQKLRSAAPKASKPKPTPSA